MNRAQCAAISALCVCGWLLPVHALGITVEYKGIGGQLGFVVPDHNYYYRYSVGNVGVGMHIAAQGKIGFSLQKYGTAYYYPSAGVWFGADHRNGYDYSIVEVQLNIFDIAYGFPLRIAAKPYVGMGPAVLIDTEHWHSLNWSDHDTWGNPGFNIFAGCDFDVNPTLRPFVEVRGKFGDWDVFKLIAGFAFTIR